MGKTPLAVPAGPMSVCFLDLGTGLGGCVRYYEPPQDGWRTRTKCGKLTLQVRVAGLWLTRHLDQYLQQPESAQKPGLKALVNLPYQRTDSPLPSVRYSSRPPQIRYQVPSHRCS